MLPLVSNRRQWWCNRSCRINIAYLIMTARSFHAFKMVPLKCRNLVHSNRSALSDFLPVVLNSPTKQTCIFADVSGNIKPLLESMTVHLPNLAVLLITMLLPKRFLLYHSRGQSIPCNIRKSLQNARKNILCCSPTMLVTEVYD